MIPATDRRTHRTAVCFDRAMGIEWNPKRDEQQCNKTALANGSHALTISSHRAAAQGQCKFSGRFQGFEPVFLFEIPVNYLAGRSGMISTWPGKIMSFPPSCTEFASFRCPASARFL
jgi:hypothetical protein